MEYKEISAKTVNEAITKACMELGLPSDRLDIEVISEGKSGFLGLGNKPAVIRVAEKKEGEPEQDSAAEADSKKSTPAEGAEADKAAAGEKEPHRSRNRRRGGKKRHEHGEEAETQRPERSRPRHEERREPLIKSDEEVAAMKGAAEAFLKDVFAAMDIEAEISGSYDEQTASLEIELSGADMGVLIGKRGQTLDSLQYLTSLVVNKNEKEYIRIKLDTEDYRRRRRETLENLAKNIANKVKKTRRPVVLEPMNPYERRIIHAALQPNNYVETYSDGNEPYRHIVVAPKRRRDYEDED